MAENSAKNSAENFGGKIRRKISSEKFGGKIRPFVRSAENFGGKFELFAALYDDSCEPQFFTYVFTDAKICAKLMRKLAQNLENWEKCT